MFVALLVGAAVVVVTITLAAVLFQIASELFGRYNRPRRLRWLVLRSILAIIFAMMWILAVLSISVWIWAAVLLALDLFGTLEEALYYALSSFTTVGYGDLIIEDNWRILGGICAANGLLIFGLFTAFLIDVLEFRIKRSEPDDHE